MPSTALTPDRPFTVLHRAASLAELAETGRKVVKIAGRQVVLFATADGVRATNNRCPHEGYPLAEGSLTEDCVLTCNWHNWKFDLKSGQTLVGGDLLRSYPVEVRDGDIFLDLSDPPREARLARAWAAFEEAFREHDYTRMAREIGRLRKVGAGSSEIAARALEWSADRLEFGSTHAQAVAADWLALHDSEPDGSEHALACLLELVGHFSWDTLREDRYPYPEGMRPWDADALVAAIEAEDEPAAIALVRGFLEEGRPYAELEHALARAALAHYQDYGHSLIYVYKTGQLAARLGAHEWLLFPLVRSLVYATREDLIPEFRAYGAALQRWLTSGLDPATGAPTPLFPGPEAFHGATVDRALALCLERDGHDPAVRNALFDELLEASAWAMLHFDERWAARTDLPVSKNTGWLDFTHALTFANAVHRLAARYPDLWPAGLLQMACFVGRLRPYLDPSLETGRWSVPEPAPFLAETRKRLFDHGQAEYIISAHLTKVWAAVDEEVSGSPKAPWVPDVLAATRRFFEASHKRKHVLRTVHQAMSFVETE
jgi:nitrite reductase/ring-hydroxylating ferredoxin subunit